MRDLTQDILELVRLTSTNLSPDVEKVLREALEKEMILKALTKTKDNVTRAAETLGISRPTLYELMEKLGIERK